MINYPKKYHPSINDKPSIKIIQQLISLTVHCPSPRDHPRHPTGSTRQPFTRRAGGSSRAALLPPKQNMVTFTMNNGIMVSWNGQCWLIMVNIGSYWLMMMVNRGFLANHGQYWTIMVDIG